MKVFEELCFSVRIKNFQINYPWDYELTEEEEEYSKRLEYKLREEFNLIEVCLSLCLEWAEEQNHISFYEPKFKECVLFNIVETPGLYSDFHILVQNNPDVLNYVEFDYEVVGIHKER